jgi:hypothetical protein
VEHKQQVWDLVVIQQLILMSTEEYDGSAWTAGGNMGTARRVLAGAGIQTAGLAIGGQTTVNVANTEEYDGTAWTAGGNLATARRGLGGAGTQTAGLAFGGFTTVNSAATEEYNGASLGQLEVI